MGSRVGTALACSTFFSRSRAKAEQRYGVQIKTIVIQEAGLDGFWIHRLLLAEGIESHVVDAASIAVARRHRRAKTDSIDGETLLRTLMAWARGERRVCSMVRAPSPEEEDRRRLTRERGTLLKERIQHTNRVKGLLSGQGVRDYNPLRARPCRTTGGAATEHGQCERVRDVRDVLFRGRRSRACDEAAHSTVGVDGLLRTDDHASGGSISGRSLLARGRLRSAGTGPAPRASSLAGSNATLSTRQRERVLVPETVEAQASRPRAPYRLDA